MESEVSTNYIQRSNMTSLFENLLMMVTSGYGKLVAIYAKYLTGSVKVLSKLDLNCKYRSLAGNFRSLTKNRQPEFTIAATTVNCRRCRSGVNYIDSGKNGRGKLTINRLETIAYIQTLQDSALELRNLLVSELKKTSYPSCRGAALNLLIRDRVNIEQAQNTVFKNLNFVDSGRYHYPLKLARSG